MDAVRSGGPARPPWDGYATATLAEADHTARFIAGCYAAFPRFEDFTAYSMFYFAAASFSELTRRLGVRADGARFLAADRHAFRAATLALSPASGPCPDYVQRVAEAIAPLNAAGLCDPRKRNWYAVDPRDAVKAAAKLGATEQAVLSLFQVQAPANPGLPLSSRPCGSPAG